MSDKPDQIRRIIVRTVAVFALLTMGVGGMVSAIFDVAIPLYSWVIGGSIGLAFVMSMDLQDDITKMQAQLADEYPVGANDD